MGVHVRTPRDKATGHMEFHFDHLIPLFEPPPLIANGPQSLSRVAHAQYQLRGGGAEYWYEGIFFGGKGTKMNKSR